MRRELRKWAWWIARWGRVGVMLDGYRVRLVGCGICRSGGGD